MEQAIKCTRCKVKLPYKEFNIRRNGEFNKQCKQCNAYTKEFRRKKKPTPEPDIEREEPQPIPPALLETLRKMGIKP